MLNASPETQCQISAVQNWKASQRVNENIRRKDGNEGGAPR